MTQTVFRHSGIANLLIVLPALLSAAAFGQATGNSAGQTLLGTPLREPAWSPEVHAELLQDLAIAKAQFEIAPEREDSFIWLGRRYGYLTRWDDAIAVFSEGLEMYPDSYKLYRFRGRHRARNRQLELAVGDYRRAAALIESQPDSFEPDGIINSRHQFLGTYKSNIHYYLAQTSYALGDYETTAGGMQRAIDEPLGYSPDRLVSTAYWHFLALRKLGLHEEARALVAEVTEGLDIIENHTYYQSVLLFNGTLTAEELQSNADSVISFAIAMQHYFNGADEMAIGLWRNIISTSAQGFWPAEAELLAAGIAPD